MFILLNLTRFDFYYAWFWHALICKPMKNQRGILEKFWGCDHAIWDGGRGKQRSCEERALKQKKLHKIWVKNLIVNQKLNFWLTIWNFCPFYLYFPKRKLTKQRLFCDEKAKNLQREKKQKISRRSFPIFGWKILPKFVDEKRWVPTMKNIGIHRWKNLRSFGDDLGICWWKLWERLRTTLDGSGSTLDKPRTTTDRSVSTSDR